MIKHISFDTGTLNCHKLLPNTTQFIKGECYVELVIF